MLWNAEILVNFDWRSIITVYHSGILYHFLFMEKMLTFNNKLESRCVTLVSIWFKLLICTSPLKQTRLYVVLKCHHHCIVSDYHLNKDRQCITCLPEIKWHLAFILPKMLHGFAAATCIRILSNDALNYFHCDVVCHSYLGLGNENIQYQLSSLTEGTGLV